MGGRTETILYDNPRTIVTSKDEASGNVEWNRRFKDRMDFYGVEVKLCRYYRAQTKGKVESGVKYVKRNALAGRRFDTIEELNMWLSTWALTIADERMHGTTHEIPRERFERDERMKMITVAGHLRESAARCGARPAPMRTWRSRRTGIRCRTDGVAPRSRCSSARQKFGSFTTKSRSLMNGKLDGIEWCVGTVPAASGTE